MNDDKIKEIQDRLDGIEQKLDLVLKKSSTSRVSRTLKILGYTFLSFLLIHVLVIGGVSAYTLIKSPVSDATELSETTLKIEEVNEKLKTAEKEYQEALSQSQKLKNELQKIKDKEEKSNAETRAVVAPTSLQ